MFTTYHQEDNVFREFTSEEELKKYLTEIFSCYGDLSFVQVYKSERLKPSCQVIVELMPKKEKAR